MAISQKVLILSNCVANILIIILAIIICCLSLGYYTDYLTCAFTIIMALCWSCCICNENNVILSAFTGLLVLDAIFLLANGIYHAVYNAKYSSFCFHNQMDGWEPTWGCQEWKDGHYQRSLGVVICYFLAFIIRILNTAGTCLMALTVYHQGDEDY